MKILKTLFALILINSIASESVEVVKVGGSVIIPITVVCLLMLMGTTWLIGSSFTREKLKLKTIRFWVFYIVNIILFLLFFTFKLFLCNIPTDFVEINGVKISLSNCVKGTGSMISTEELKRESCKCLAEKLSENELVKTEFIRELERGKFVTIINHLKEKNLLNNIELQDCFVEANATWTPKLISSVRKEIMNINVDTDFENTNDLDKYCDCVIEEFKKRPFSEVVSNEFQNGEEIIEIMNNCVLKSEK